MRFLSTRYIVMLLSLSLFTLSVYGCAGKKPLRMPVATIQGLTRHFYPGQIISLPGGNVISFEALIRTLSRKRLIFVGEVHNNPEDHLMQIQILQALMDHEPQPDVAMEFFQVSQQQAINRYFNGETDETQFLKEADWRKNWGFPYRFYRPLVLATKHNGRRLIAINAPREIVRKVARQGLKALEPSERSQLAKDIDLTNEGHRAFVRKIYSHHAHQELKRFEYFYQAQCVWEDTMAEHIAEFLKKHHGNLIVFAGNGHILNRYGVPNRVSRRIPVSMATVATYSLDGPVEFKSNAADFIWLTAGSFSWHGTPMTRMHMPPLKKDWKKE